MKLFTAEQIRGWDLATIKKGVASIQLMERAANALIPKILTLVSNRCSVGIIAGPGNNGGDALALTRLLEDRGFEQITTYLLRPHGSGISDDCRSNLERISAVIEVSLEQELPDTQTLASMDLIIDGLFGTGLSRPLNGLFAEVVERVNRSGTEVVSIDIPSGSYCDSFDPDSPVIQADHVLTFQIPKRSFLVSESSRYMDHFEIVDIHLDADYHELEPCDRKYLKEEDVELPTRIKFSHKGDYGHGLLVAGSRGMYGAALLAARAALRAGSGLLTVHAPSEAMDIIQATLPEAMYSMDRQVEHIGSIPELTRYSSVACGPGLGTAKDTIGVLDALLSEAPNGLILDADALNIIAQEGWQDRIPSQSILTPHPKEFSRLFGEFQDSFQAIDKQQEIAKKKNWVIIRKGAHSTVALPDGRVFFNSSGNPYMASGGMGDVLTGFILGLRAQGLTPEEAALAGVFYHGQAGDRALQRRRGGLLMSSDVIEAFKVN